MNIDRAEVITISRISPGATPTILRRIDWLNSENDLTAPRIDRGEARESGSGCFDRVSASLSTFTGSLDCSGRRRQTREVSALT